MAAHGGDAEAITDVSLELGQAYVAGAREQCPNARISFDLFHVIALANTALDQVRCAEAINGRIQAATARARGYGTDRHLTTMCYLICRKLTHLPANPWLHPQAALQTASSTSNERAFQPPRAVAGSPEGTPISSFRGHRRSLAMEPEIQL